MLASGTRVGRYAVLDLLGEGAMGEVYRAWDDALDRVVALKLLLPLRAESEAARKRFSREARLSARVNHPCVAHVYDVGEHAGSPFITMEFVPGRQLRAELNSPMREDRAQFLLRQILEGLSEAHREGIVHRDLKPENIMISGRDQVKILDFGLAKPVLGEAMETNLSTTGITGTPRYMAPEQVHGTQVDARTDLYAAGAIGYEMLTGKPCHAGRSLGEILMAVASKPAPKLPADTAPALADLIGRCLAKTPSQRPASAEDALEALERVHRPSAPAGFRPPSDIGERPPPHPRAVAYAQRGREALTGLTSSSSLSMEMLQEALQIDPDYAVAHAVYGEACAAIFNTGHADATWLDRAQSAIDKAAAIDPELPDVYVARARLVWTKTFNFPAETALRELKYALAADPDHAGALRLWATIAGHVGLFAQSEAALTRRLAADPRDMLSLMLQSALHSIQGHHEAARAVLDRMIRLDPKHEDPMVWWQWCHALVIAGDHERAATAVDATLERHPQEPQNLALRGVIHALQGEVEQAIRLAKEAEACSRTEMHPHHVFHLLAILHSVLGETQTSLHWLVRTATEGFPCHPWFMTDPLLKNLREAPASKEFYEDSAREHQYFASEFPLSELGEVTQQATLVDLPEL